MTLQLARRVQKQIMKFGEENPGSDIKVHLTRTGDTNLSLSDRAQTAMSKRADVFMSIHFNGFNGSVCGTETLIRSSANGNLVTWAELEMQRLQSIKQHNNQEMEAVSAKLRDLAADLE